MNLDTALQMALAHQRAGQHAQAGELYRQVLAVQPDHPDALHLLGMAMVAGGRTDEGLALIRRAIASSPAEPVFRSNLGEVYRRLGRIEEAIACCREALALREDQPDVHLNLGQAFASAGRFEEAVASFRRALMLGPDWAQAHYNLAVVLSRAGREEEAMASYRRALELEPAFYDALCNLGELLTRLGRLDEAIERLRGAIALHPMLAPAHHNLGSALARAGRSQEAMASFRRALEIDPAFGEALSNLGEQLTRLDRWDKAVACLRRAVALRPDSAVVHNNLGNALARSNQHEEASACFRRALAVDPDFVHAHWNHAMLLFRLGHWAGAWREYEWRWRYPEFRSTRRDFTQPQWDGTPVPGATILVHCEQGFGDATQFVRYVSLVRARAQATRVILECPVSLVRLFEDAEGLGADIIAASDDTAKLPPFDLHVPLLSLPFVLGKHEPLPMAVPYLRARENAPSWGEWDGRREFRVGLAWAGNPTHADDAHRSIAPEKFLPIVRVPGVNFYSLQIASDEGTPAAAQIESLIDLTAHLADFADTAALIAKLDLVIAVDTAVAHLAGALGRPVWVLLAFLPDWRWGLEREDTPWYPSMRLFRQPSAGDWDSVVRRVADELQRLRR